MNESQTSTVPVADPRHPALQGQLLRSGGSNGWGALVLHGSSGRIDLHAAELLARTGAIVFAQQWFGQPGLPEQIQDVPLESFVAGIDMLVSHGCSRIAVLGRSRGAEAALLLATIDPRVNAVFAFSPSSVAWAGTSPDGGPSWTFEGWPVPYVSYDLSWWSEPRQGLIEYREYHERSLRMDPAATARAEIPVERTSAQMILVAGAADALWPSDTFARAIAQRLRQHGRECNLITHADAGHRVLLPGETTPRSSAHAHGGSDDADAELGATAWSAIEQCMREGATAQRMS